MSNPNEVPNVVVAVPAATRARVFPRGFGAAEERARTHVLPDPVDYDSEASCAALADATVLLTGWGTPRITDAALSRATRLQAIVHSAGTVRAIVPEAVYDRGIVISNQNVRNGSFVADFTLAMIILAAKRAFTLRSRYRDVRLREARPEPIGISGRTVGLWGASSIARAVIERLRPYDFRVLVADPYLTVDDAAALGVIKVELAELFATSDIVSLHAPLLPETTGAIGADLIGRMRDGATLINTARGALVDEPALITELQTGRIDAMLDVTWPEPPEPGSPLWTLDNVFLTPHIAGAVGTEVVSLGDAAIREVMRVLDGQPLHHEISRAAYRTMA